MVTQPACNGWWLASHSTIAVLFGLAARWSDRSLAALGLLFGAYALTNGCLTLIMRWPDRQELDHKWTLLLKGLTEVVIGMCIYFWPSITAQALGALIVIWALLTGALEVVAMFDLRNVVTRERRRAWNGMIQRQLTWDNLRERNILRSR